MIELKLTLRYDDTALSAKATGGTPQIVLDQMDEIIKDLKNLELQNFWARMTEYASKPALTSAFNLKSTHVSGVNLEEQAKQAPAKSEVKIFNIASKSGQPYKCSKCGGFISWDLRPERVHPLHCNKLGQIIGDGDCPAYNQ